MKIISKYGSLISLLEDWLLALHDCLQLPWFADNIGHEVNSLSMFLTDNLFKFPVLTTIIKDSKRKPVHTHVSDGQKAKR